MVATRIEKRNLVIGTLVFFIATALSAGCSTTQAKPVKPETSATVKKAKPTEKMIGKAKKRFNPDDYSLTSDGSLDERYLKTGEAALSAPALESPDAVDESF